MWYNIFDVESVCLFVSVCVCVCVCMCVCDLTMTSITYY